MRVRWGLVLGLLLVWPLSALADGLERRIAITINDLPWQRVAQTPPDALSVRHARLLASLRRADAPVMHRSAIAGGQRSDLCACGSVVPKWVLSLTGAASE